MKVGGWCWVDASQCVVVAAVTDVVVVIVVVSVAALSKVDGER